MNTRSCHSSTAFSPRFATLPHQAENVENVRDNSGSFGIIPLNPNRSNTQPADSETTTLKHRSGGLEEKISLHQHSRSFEMLPTTDKPHEHARKRPTLFPVETFTQPATSRILPHQRKKFYAPESSLQFNDLTFQRFNVLSEI